ncbi:MAG TPA: hypothetical protein VNO52_00810, partial [Methylomirabilota bacterium]|nr:hypothetical protein [Methylomirabilota bacterium]
MDPTVGESSEQGISTGIITIAGKPYLSLSFIRRRNDTSVIYVVETSTDNKVWKPGTGVRLVGTTAVDGSLERVTYRDSSALAPNRPRFMRLKVLRPAD